MYSGIFAFSWWGYILVTLAFTHITIAAVTIYLHRHSAHRALDLHPIASHFFRFWLWLTTGMQTKQWTAVHRKHHARCETPDDPHSPQVFGVAKVVWQGADLYTTEARRNETCERFGYGTPDDWIERNVYTPHPVLGIAAMMVLDFALFGFIGLTIWAAQMMWIPFFAAGIVNGVGHYWGYRSLHVHDASRNIVPWGIIIGGEELHNNHHAYPSSARLSSQWYEFDIGWMYIRILQQLKLATIRKVAPRLKVDPSKAVPDLATLQAVITHRYAVITTYARSLKDACAAEFASRRELFRRDHVPTLRCIKRWLAADPNALSEGDRSRL